MNQGLLAEKGVFDILTPRQALASLWERGLSGADLLREHSALIDEFIREKFFSAFKSPPSGLCMVALGGYGRKELFPYSDIDLLLLYEDEQKDSVEKVTEAVFYPLWDAGLEVGHGVRTVDACMEDIDTDFFFMVSLLDARPICGDEKLFTKLSDTFLNHFGPGARKKFAQDMMVHREERHKRYGDHTYLLEPNIKESRGGLRDLHAIIWTGKVLFGLKNLEEFSSAGLMSKQELAAVLEARDNLFIVRNRLHHASGRKNDRLFFEYQEEIAKALRFYDTKDLLGVERFMRNVHRNLQTISVASDLFFEHVVDVINPPSTSASAKTLSKGIELLRGRIVLTDQALLKERPYIMMKAFAISAKDNIPLHYRSRKLIASVCRELDPKWRSSRKCARYFLEILRHSNDSTVLDQMLDSGLLTSFIPEFEHLKALVIHDVYHVNTVDKHLIESVVQLNGLRERYPSMFHNVEDDKVLLLATFLHDIGKGRGGGHAQKGAEIVIEIGKRFGFTESEVDCLSFLIANHLYLIDNATRRDLEDESLILKFARHIKRIDRLSMLYLITIADSLATGPNVWNEWKEALLLEVYHKIAHLLEQHELVDPDRIAAVNWMKQKVSELLGDEAQQLLPILPEDYLLSFTPQAISMHMTLKKKLAQNKVLCIPEDRGNFWSVLLMTTDRTGLLSKICGTFVLYGLSILQAQIFTLKDGTVVDVLDVRSLSGSSFSEINWEGLCDDLKKAVQDRLGLNHRLAEKFSRMSFKEHKVSIRPKTRVVIDNKQSDFYTIIEVYAQDSPCLLYSITKTLAEFNINIHKAKIGTSADQVVDVFYVLDELGQRIEEEDFIKELEKALEYAAVSCVF